MTSMRPMEINTDIVDSNILNNAALKLKPLWKDFDKQKNAFYDVRDEIDEDLRFCADNVQVVIYLSDVVDEPMVISSGSKENKLRITVKSDGTVTKEWKKVIWTVEKVSCHVLNEAFLSTKHLLRGHYEQETVFYRIRDEIDQDLNCCADNVKVVIYVNNVLDRPIVISSGSKENELRITIKKDGSVRKEWKKTTWRSEKVDNEALIDTFLKIKPFFKGFDKQKFAFYGVRDEINEDVKLCAENVKVEIHVDDVLDNPIIISSGLQENSLKITIKTDGAVMRKWERITWIPEEIITEKVDNEALIDAFLKIKPFFKGFDKQKFAFYCVRNEINEDVKLCAENVKVEIHVDDVLDNPIIISSGLQENNLKITIKTDGAVMRKWERITWIPEEIITEKVDNEALIDAFLKIKPFFKGFDKQKFAFYCVRNEINEDVKLCAENVKVEIHVDDVLDNPIIISSGLQENNLKITIKTDGAVMRKWERITWIPEEIITEKVDNEALIDAFLKIKPFFKGFDKQKFAFYCVRNEINEDVKLCAENVKVEIHVDDVLDNPIIISSGLQENNLKITIKTDGAVMRKWERITWIPQEFKTEKIDSDDLKGAISKIKPLFKGFANHKKAFDKLQDEFHDNVKTCADNVRVEIHVDKVIERPIVICTERQDNQLRITINEDGNRTTKWEKTTWRKYLFDEWERKKKSASNCMNIEMEKVTSRFFSWVFASVTLEITKKIANYCMRFFEDKFAISETFRSAFQRNLPLFQFFI